MFEKLKDRNLKVYVDPIEKWQDIKQDNVKLLGLFNNRATVETDNGTNVNRILKYVEDNEEIKADGCIYAIKKPTHN